jgi:threonine/homoserine/homoserine lactone efflux protein
MTSALAAGVVAGYAVAIPMGPVGVYLMTVGARAPLRVAAAGALGIATVDGSYALAAVLGGRAAADALQPALGVLRWVSVAVLLVVAGRIAHTALRPAPAAVEPARPPSVAGAFRTFVLITAVNPGTLVFFAALVVGLRSPGSAFAFVPAVFAASLSWQLALAGSGALLGRVLGGPQARRGTALVGALVTAGLAVHLAL